MSVVRLRSGPPSEIGMYRAHGRQDGDVLLIGQNLARLVSGRLISRVAQNDKSARQSSSGRIPKRNTNVYAYRGGKASKIIRLDFRFVFVLYFSLVFCFFKL